MIKKYKYPRTYHVTWSEGCTSDDKKLITMEHFKGKMVVVTEKMDGENTTIYSDGSNHARSVDSRYHDSRSYVKSLASKICSTGLILPEERICGENLFAKHSIYYDNLDDYFLAFSIWDGNWCKSWESTIARCVDVGIKTVPVLYRGVYDEKIIKNIKLRQDMEGYVIRLDEGFYLNEFSKSVAKFVRKNHVQTDKHWMEQEIVKNKLKESLMK
jgi:hypothetical protein